MFGRARPHAMARMAPRWHNTQPMQGPEQATSRQMGIVMSEPSSDKSNAAVPLRVGVIADAVSGETLRAYLEQSEHWELAAAAGSPENNWPEGVPYFDDRRVMLAQTALDAVIVADSTKVGIELGDMAVRHGLAIWRNPPLGRTFAEACEQLRLIRGSEPVYCLGSRWRMLLPMLEDCWDEEEPFQPGFSEVRIAARGPSVQSWRAGQIDAGGGVAVLDAYEAVEALIGLRGIPDNVSAATGKFRRRPGEAARETEDVAAAIFRYDGGGVAVLNLTWDLPPERNASRHHDASVTLEIAADGVRMLNFEGAVTQSSTVEQSHLNHELDRFAGLIRRDAIDVLRDVDLDRHLAVSAVLEALYLSAQTWQPELPRRLYEVQGWPLPDG
jgi:predicted dehydrogenase